MNLKRVLTGLIGFPIVIAILMLGNKYIIDVLFAIIALISMHEYLKAIEKKYKPTKFLRLYFRINHSIYTFNTFKISSKYIINDNTFYSSYIVYKYNSF